MRFIVFLITLIIFNLCYINVIAETIDKLPDDLVYPGAKIISMEKFIKAKVFVQITPDNFNTVVSFFIKMTINSDWEIIFPDEKELQIWLEALKIHKNNKPVLMIQLINLKTKFNYNLNIGNFYDTSSKKYLTIITVHITNSKFG